jgi:hypothetical protein
MVDVTKLDPKIRRILSPVAGEHISADVRKVAMSDLALELQRQYPNDDTIRAIGVRIADLNR